MDRTYEERRFIWLPTLWLLFLLFTGSAFVYWAPRLSIDTVSTGIAAYLAITFIILVKTTVGGFFIGLLGLTVSIHASPKWWVFVQALSLLSVILTVASLASGAIITPFVNLAIGGGLYILSKEMKPEVIV